MPSATPATLWFYPRKPSPVRPWRSLSFPSACPLASTEVGFPTGRWRAG